MNIRTGDVVFHRPSGHNLLVAYVRGDRFSWCGWPDGEGNIADCDVVKRCSDREHEDILRRIVRGFEGDYSSDRRGSYALRDLAALLMSRLDAIGEPEL